MNDTQKITLKAVFRIISAIGIFSYAYLLFTKNESPISWGITLILLISSAIFNLKYRNERTPAINAILVLGFVIGLATALISIS